MYPDYERNNYPMSITDEDGPFLVMEAELFYNDELNDEFKKSRARHYYSCASAATALFYCKSLADKDDNPWYVSWKRRSSSIRWRSARAQRCSIGLSRPIR